MAISNQFKQSHFVIYELQLPFCTTCTPSGDLTQSWHTPVTCDESSDSTYSLWFTSNNSPIMSPPSQAINIKSRLNSSIFRVVSSGSESTPELKPGEGMASRGTMSVTLTDFLGDPGPINFSDSGTFFGKLTARNILDGKKVVSHYYAIVNNSPDPVEVSTSTHFITSSRLSSGNFKISGKDALKDLEAFSQQFPIPTESQLTSNIDASTTTIPVTDGSLYSANDVVIIDKELIKIQSIAGNVLTSFARGATLVASDSVQISQTEASTHTNESTVQICYVMSKRFLSDVLADVFIAVGLSAYTNLSQWTAEITEWNSNAFLYGVFHEPKDADEIINKLLTNYMVDLWLDQATQLVVINAVTSWKQSQRIITEGDDLYDLRTASKANTRYSRAYIYNDKDFQAENDDATNYSRLTLHKDTATESSDLYGSIKLKEFDPSNFITPASATILVSRYVQRFAATPEVLTFKMEERKLAASKLGDVVQVVTRDSQTPAGEYLQSSVRAQLIEIKPDLNEVGRVYKVKALSYIPLIATTPGGAVTIFISGNEFDINLYARAGAPPFAVDVTFVFDNATIGSSQTNIPAITAGNFDAASNLKLIFINNSKISARGGNGGSSFGNGQDNGDDNNINATGGADIYTSNGVTTEIYLNYGVVDSYTTSSEFYAAGGGGGSAKSFETFNTGSAITAAAGGGGGSGIPAGLGGRGKSTSFPYSSADGGNGTFSSTGSGGSATNSNNFNFSATSGSGGFSVDGAASSATFPAGGGEDLTALGLAGGAIKGTNVTVYNLAADASKFRAGNSDAFTLVTS